MTKKTIVIVDDQYATRLILSELVSKIDIGVPVVAEAFQSVQDAYQWLESNDAHLFILDYMMDEVSGHEMLKTLKNHHKFSKTPVIAMSADNDKSVKYQFLEDGAADFFVKPFDYHECMLKCRNLLLSGN
jgi:DNA-binding response OmpR family regulator